MSDAQESEAFRKRALALETYAESLAQFASEMPGTNGAASDAIGRAVTEKKITSMEAYWVSRRAFGPSALIPTRVELEGGADLTEVGESLHDGVVRWRERAEAHAVLIDDALKHPLASPVRVA